MSNIVRLVSASDVTTRKKQQGTTNRYNAMQDQNILPIGGIPFADLYDIAHTSAIYTDQTTACIPCEGDVNFVLRQYKPISSDPIIPPDPPSNFIQRSVPGPPPTRLWTGVASSGDGVYLAAIAGLEVFISSDSGLNWTNTSPVGSGDPWTSITMNSTGQYMGLCRNSGVYFSINYGATWAAAEGSAAGSPVPLSFPWKSISYSSDGIIAAVGGTNSEIWISNSSNGAVWFSLSTSFGPPNAPVIRNWSGVACGSFGGGYPRGVGIEGTHIWVFDSSTLVQKSYTGSFTWRAVACNNDRSVIFVVSSTDKIILKSINSGVTWTTATPAPSLNWSGISVSPDGTKIFACAEGGQLYKSTDTGATWIALDSSRQWKGVASSSDGAKLAAADYGTLPNGGYIYTGAFT